MSDICLLLEGTYPYVTGGVSSCAHQLIEATPDLNYSLVFIGTNKSNHQKMKYRLPKNVYSLDEVFLFDNSLIQTHEPKSLGLSLEDKTILRQSILFEREGDIEQLYYRFFHKQDPADLVSRLFFSLEIWDILLEKYHGDFSSSESPSFIDYFYNWRFSNLPIFKILATTVPKSTIYHSLCTGYAGLLGCVAKMQNAGAFILTEHGIYTHERKIEVSQSEWIHTNKEDLIAKHKLSYFKQWWLNKFYRLGELAYDFSDDITTLFEGNKAKQIELAADPSKISIIANGISEEKLTKGIDPHKIFQKGKKYTVALIGRVVPIKDIKTFIKSTAVIYDQFEDVEFLILGPYDEDPEYYNDCNVLVEQLGLSNVINFCGKVELKHFYPAIDVVVLSSISEGQPLVLLEAFCFSIPVVTTDVGSCFELVHGKPGEDQELGEAGHIVPFGRADLLGEKILDLLHDDFKREEFGKSGYQRFIKYYQEHTSISNYRDLYQKYFLDEI